MVAIVAEMTGYPPDLLDLDLDLEADLGVDTVKQAEVFAAVRARFGVERDDTLSLRDFPTLTHVIGWVRDKTATPADPPTRRTPPHPPRPRRRTPSAPASAADPGAARLPSQEEITEAVVAIVAEMTGYPPDLLDLDLDLEADLGVDTVKQAEVFAAVRARFGVERDDTLSLRDFPTLTHVIGWVRDKTATQPNPPRPAAPAAPAPPAAWRPRAHRRPPQTAAPAAPGEEEITEAVVAIVAEMTGYPPDLLDLDLDLEADLGVDTVKQAEVFAAVRARFGVERDDTLSLRDFPTLTPRHRLGPRQDRHPSRTRPTRRTRRTRRGRLATPSAPASPQTAAPAAPSEEEMTEAVVAIVAEMTGYPPDLLDLDLDLEADLGVDTVKQAEVFAAVRARFGVERDDTLSLRDFPTLTHVIGWVRDKTATRARHRRTAPHPLRPAARARRRPHRDAGAGRPARRAPDHGGRRPRRRRRAAATRARAGAPPGARPVRAHRRRPRRGHPRRRDAGRGRRRGRSCQASGQGRRHRPAARPGDVRPSRLLAQLDAWRSEGEIAGVYWLAALDDEGPHDSLDLAGWREALRRRVKALYATMRRLYDDSPFLVAATRLGGFHGYDDGRRHRARWAGR